MVVEGSDARPWISSADQAATVSGEKTFSRPWTMWRSTTCVLMLSMKVLRVTLGGISRGFWTADLEWRNLLCSRLANPLALHGKNGSPYLVQLFL